MADIFQSSPIINLVPKMDSRTSSEALNINPNQTGLVWRNLQNGDAFYSKALGSRPGVIDLGGGIINASGESTAVYTLYSGNTTGSIKGTYVQPVFMQPLNVTREGLLINIPSSGVSPFLINGGTILLQDVSSTQTVIEAGYDINIQMYLAQVGAFNQTVNSFYDTFVLQPHSIALSGNFNALYNAPTLVNISSGSNIDPTPLAISESTIVNFGPSTNYILGNNPNISSSYATSFLEVPFQFAAPYALAAGTYFLYIVANNTSGVSTRDIQAQIIYDNVDISQNTSYIGMTNNIVSGVSYDNILGTHIYTWPNFSGTKGWLAGEVDQYNSTSYTLIENPAVSYVVPTPISGANFNPDINTQAILFNNISPAPNSLPLPSFTVGMSGISTSSAEFGQIFTAPSGSYVINGGYIYANAWGNTNWNAQTRNNTPIDIDNYNTNYVCNLYQVLGSTGVQSSGNLTYQTTLLATYNGTYLFNNPNTYQNPYTNGSLPGAEINSGLEKIQSLFPNPVNITTNGTTEYLMSWQFLNPSNNQPINDFEVVTEQLETANNVYSNYYSFSPPILAGFTTNVLSTPNKFVRREANGFQAYVASTSLSFGVYSIPSGNGITLIYNFAIGADRLSKVIIGQESNLYVTTFDNPTDMNTIFSGAQVGTEFLWDATTYNNLMFATQYSNSGTQVCWDQIYTQPSGNWTQPWGLQPQWSMYPVSGIVASTGNSFYSGQSLGYGLASGNSVQVMLATQMNSGGYRADVQNFTASGNNVYIGFSGLDIFRVSGNSTNSQYQFDVVPQSTYLFVTQAADINGNAVSGTSPNNSSPATTDIFYLAEVLSEASGLSSVCLNPLSNSGTFVGQIQQGSGTIVNPYGHIYLGDFDANTLTQQIPSILNYNQAYLDEQIPTPKFKKTVVFFNYIIGVGDPSQPAGFYYSGLSDDGSGQPQIWGVDGQVCGFIPIAPNSPQGNTPITGIEVFRDNLFIFTYNAIYRFVYSGNPGNPFIRYTMSNVLGSLGFFGTVSTDYGVFFLSQFGPALVSLGPPDTIGDEIVNTFNNFDQTNLTFAVAVYDRERQQIYWSISNDIASPDNQTGLIYSTATQSWNIRQGGMWLSAGIVWNFDDFNELWIGTSNGQLQQISVGDSDQDSIFVDVNGNLLSQSITLTAETPWLTLGDAQSLKRLKSILINCETSEQQLQIDVYMNQNDDYIQCTRYLTMNNPVTQRWISVGGPPCNSIKLVITSIGSPDAVKIKSLQFKYQDMGINING